MIISLKYDTLTNGGAAPSGQFYSTILGAFSRLPFYHWSVYC